MNDKTLHTLEFHKVREHLAQFSSFGAGRALAIELEPSTDVAQVKRNQRITTEAARLLSLRPDATLGGARDIRENVRRAELGSVLDPADILAVLDTLQASRNLRNLIVRTAEQKEGLQTLAFIADGISPLPKVEAEIERCINAEGQVLDSASPALGKIRANIRVAHNRLLSKLQQIISSESSSRALQEPIITLRNGRYVVPVKRDFQGQLRGIVHDQSNTGSTVFVEPLAIVELGNEWRQLQMEETQEIERILRELGALIGSHAETIRTNVEILADLDLAFAKARYSLAIHGVEPDIIEANPNQLQPQRPPNHRQRTKETDQQIQNPKSKIQNQEQGLFFKNARHPLLTGNVVPITVELGTTFRMLVITGPNTGGKTVALKTVGLLTLMAQAGLHIPADHGSRAAVFKDVFADIGDEQSIEQSLSTFSSHMSNIIGILKNANKESMVLLDELGAGTDPQEGSALARSIIGHILDVGALSVCTTHYSELKAFAYITPGVENASVEFNVETLSPTYRLMIGVPGRSNAFAIANRLGLSHTIIDKARRFIDPEAQNVEDLLENIRSERETARSERGTAEQTRLEIEEQSRELQRRLAEADEMKARAVEDAHAQVASEIDTLRDELRRLRGRVEAGLAATSDETLTKQWVQEAQDRADELDRQLKTETTRYKKARAHRPPTTDHRPLTTNKAAHVLGPGDTVFVQTLGAEGEVIGQPNGNQIEVQVGAFKMRVPTTGVQLRQSASTQRENAVTSSAGRYAPVMPAVPPPLEYDFRGWRAEAAIEEIDQRLGEAALVGMPFLRIIHGKGTGALRKAMREYLKKHSLVKEIETAPIEQGGEGVTIVRL
ncbi:MAG: Smr/MutS family protein [Chloroflexia bacterium]